MTTPPPWNPQPCEADGEGTGCMQPMQFCQTSTSTGPVEHPGRMYDITLPINPGFEVQSLQVDAVTHAAGIVWDVADPDGEAFRQELTTFMEGRLPAPAVVTITNPNAGVPQVCGTALAMQIHIECLRLDQDPPDLVELIYNAGQDLIQNPAYNEFPPLNPPVSQGNYGFRLLSRQDDPGPFPGNPPANDVLCTSIANQGWETNDVGRTFEIWGDDVASSQNTTPTPRGTPVQEITSDGPPPGGTSTIWQTFTAPFNGNFIIRLVHGARDPGETHRITLDFGDTDDAQNGDLIDDVSNPPSVTSNGGPNPWTQFNQTIPLNGGQTYTLALSNTDPSPNARGGLFTDMRAYIDRPDTRATATTDDETCVVTVEETQTTTVCTFWTPECEGGEVTTWQNTQTGVTLTNAEFWAQTPTPSCCLPEAAEGEGGGGGSANLAVSDIVCGVVGGVPTSLVRQVVMDPSGGTLVQQFIGPDGAPVTPASWTPGSCTDQRFLSDEVLCDVDPGTGEVITSFLRKYVQTWSPQAGSQITETRDFVLNGSARYTPIGTVQVCDSANRPFTTTGLCLADGTPIGVVYHRAGNQPAMDGWVNFLTGSFTAGAPPVGTRACDEARDVELTGTLCDVDGNGDVIALVLVEYSYNPDGSLASVQLINATTGAPYTPTGTVTVCPAGAAVQPEQDLVVLCDVDPLNEVTPFIRDFRRDANGAVIGVSNYTLAGAAYTPTGTVTICDSADPTQEVLCDANGTRFLRTYQHGADGQIIGSHSTDFDGTPFAPVGVVVACDADVADTELLILCDDNGSFQRRYTFDGSGAVVTTADFTLAGTPYVPVGTVTYGCTDPTATAQVYASCEDIPSEQFQTGPNLLANGDFEQSNGVGATSVVGPGWTSGYTACGPDLFSAPCGAERFAYFTTNAGQVMGSGGNANANAIEALGNRSFAVNVGGNVNLPILEWQNIFLENGKTYELSADASIVFAPFDVALKIGGPTAPGGLFPLSTPPTGNWGKTTATFTYTGATGYTQVGLYSNNPAAAGNDHTFDNISLHTIQQAQAGTLTPRVYSGTQRAVIEQVVDVHGCNDDRRDALLGDIVDGFATFNPGRDVEQQVLCDANGTRFIRTYVYDVNGVMNSFADRTFANAAFAPVGAVGVCATTITTDTDFVEEVLCDVSGAGVSTPFIRLFRFNSATGALISSTNTTLTGAAYTPSGTVGLCSDECCPITVAEVCLANGNPGVILRLADGTLSRVDTVTGNTFAPGDIVSCQPTVNAQMRSLAAGQSWTPGTDVTGILTSVTFTVISGTATVTDSNGTVSAGLPAGYSHTWSNQNEATLTGPQSIAAVGGTVIVGWTQR